MLLIDYISDPERKRALATAVGCSEGYLWQMASGWRGKRPSAELAAKIEQATAGQITRAALRPDLFGELPALPEPAKADAAEAA